ncbi:MAG: hypothetical protein Q9217_001080 [Psora testacea]
MIEIAGVHGVSAATSDLSLMSQSVDDEVENVSYEEDESLTGRPAKRRRLSHPSSAFDDDSDNVADPTSSAALSGERERSGSQQEEGHGKANEKPRFKYKSHIPKNAELPKDTFFSQPPQRSSSPYRIEQFHWQKPKIPSPTPTVRKAVSRNSHVSTTSARSLGGESESSTDQLIQSNAEDYDVDRVFEDVLADLPLDAISLPAATTTKPNAEPIFISSQQDYDSRFPQQRLVAPLANLKQTTLFGTQAQRAPSLTQSKRKHHWPMANREEPPTHHEIDKDAMKTWVYPTNLGNIRHYQFSIVARGLYHNMLVALPTGLGKTFIAATIMLNWFRWTTTAQIVFVAPTKPLVSQQVKACFEIAGIPRSATSMLTGTTSPGLRAEVWKSKRVFFMTPQTLINDLKSGICDPKRLVLIVVDEAHRATGSYAYVEVVNFVKRFNTSFRVLALTATPGASIESVQEVIDGLGISRVEIRTEESLDIREYVHSRKIETVLFDNSDEMVMVMDLFSKALQPVLDKLIGINAYWTRDPMTLTPYGCTQARQRWYASDAGRKAPGSLKGMVMTIFGLLASLSHAIELLKFHGIGPFYHKVLAFRNNLHSKGQSGDKYANQINTSQPFQTMMSRVQIWINTTDFVGHPKLEYLQSVVLNHFLDAGEGRGASDPSSTRIMVFSHYRDSAEEIARVLERNGPMVRPHVFVGQASTKGSEGMDQKTQLNIIEKFKSGIYNTLVATSIGEEGLDIGEVDLIVCYDASASPIRMLQRMGRTGRKRAGNIVVTLMKGKEENNFVKAKDNYEKMQSEIASGARFNFHDEEARRIVPKDIQPVVDKRVVDIPPENTQADLPEPTKRGRPPKRPPKKFHMPDGVRTGFVKASRLDNDGRGHPARSLSPKHVRPASPAPIPALEEVFLTPAEEKSFERKYLDIKDDTSQIVEALRLDAFPSLQRHLRPTKHIGHGRATKRIVKAFRVMHTMTGERAGHYDEHLSLRDREECELQARKRARYSREPPKATPPVNLADTISSTAVSSSEELDSLRGFVDDRVNGAASSKSSSPPLVKPYKPFYCSQKQVINQDPESGEDLPDLSALVQNDERPATVGLGLRRGGKRVVDCDSDDE